MRVHPPRLLLLAALAAGGAIGLAMRHPDAVAAGPPRRVAQSVRVAQPMGVAQNVLPPLPAPAGQSQPAQKLVEHRLVGPGACSASSCHGGAHPGTTGRNEHSIWIQRDPHAAAWTTLLNERSQKIARNLGLKQGAHNAQVCLSCHAGQPEGEPETRAFINDGVSCEACHGAAEHWLEPHKRLDWKGRPAAEKSRYGFIETKDLVDRTRACAQCHVGSEGKDVTHDLIAAGHPRLTFEMAAHQSLMPRHWSLAEERSRTPNYEATLWAVGQVAAAKASLELLEQRAAQSQTGKGTGPWPEFAEYACFACHHDLKFPSERQSLAPAGALGSYRWGTWQFSLLDESVSARDPQDLKSAIAGLRKSMERPFPDRKDVAAKSGAVRTLLGAWTHELRARPLDTNELRGLMQALSAPPPASDREWDASAQRFLGLVAIQQSRQLSAQSPPAEQAEIRNTLVELRGILQLPGGSGSPAPNSSKKPSELFRAIHSTLERHP